MHGPTRQRSVDGTDRELPARFAEQPTFALVAPPVIISAPFLAPTEVARRWAALLQQFFEVDPLACPTCHGPIRMVAFISQASVIDQMLA